MYPASAEWGEIISVLDYVACVPVRCKLNLAEEVLSETSDFRFENECDRLLQQVCSLQNLGAIPKFHRGSSSVTSVTCVVLPIR